MNMKKSLVLLTLGILAMVTFPVVALADPELGIGELNVLNAGGDYDGLGTFKTISIRACNGSCMPPNPLQACGVVVVHGDTGIAHMHSVNGSGISGIITFQDDTHNGILYVGGAATGLDPDADGGYVSLIYDNGSVQSGPEACEPHLRNLHNMFVGAWTVIEIVD